MEAARAGIELAAGDAKMEARLRHRLGTAQAQTGDARGALEQFQRAVQLAPDFAGAHYSLGVMLQGLGRRGEAITHLSAALKHDPTYTEARDALAELKAPAGHYRQHAADR
jgi:tetratricopeptide (TPR) repeat protein